MIEKIDIDAVAKKSAEFKGSIPRLCYFVSYAYSCLNRIIDVLNEATEERKEILDRLKALEGKENG